MSLRPLELLTIKQTLDERELRALINDETSTFNDTLSKSNDETINMQKLMIGKYHYGLSAPLIKKVFRKMLVKYNLRNCRVAILPNPKTKKSGTDMIAYKAAQLWSTLPRRYYSLRSLDLFKSKKAGIIVIFRARFVQFLLIV